MSIFLLLFIYSIIFLLRSYIKQYLALYCHQIGSKIAVDFLFEYDKWLIFTAQNETYIKLKQTEDMSIFRDA